MNFDELASAGWSVQFKTEQFMFASFRDALAFADPVVCKEHLIKEILPNQRTIKLIKDSSSNHTVEDGPTHRSRVNTYQTGA